MGLNKITYEDKSNSKEIVDRKKQATAEDFNEIKEVVNEAIDEVESFQNQIESSEVIFSVASEQEMIDKWISEDAAGRTPINGKEQVIRTDLNQFWKWDSTVASKAIYSRPVSITHEIKIQEAYVLLNGKTDFQNFEVNDKFRAWLGDRYVVGKIIAPLIDTFANSINDRTKIKLVIDNEI